MNFYIHVLRKLNINGIDPQPTSLTLSLTLSLTIAAVYVMTCIKCWLKIEKRKSGNIFQGNVRLSNDHIGSPDVVLRSWLSPEHCSDRPHWFPLVVAAKCKLFRVFHSSTLIKMFCVSLGNSVKWTTREVKADYVATHPDMVNQSPHKMLPGELVLR